MAQRVIHARMTVRQVAYDYPETRAIFERYGVQASPGATFGTLEPLDRFASRVGVSLPQLLQELASAAQAEIDWQVDWALRNHRGFLASALAISLTLGATWGAWLLWEMGYQGSFDAVPVAHVIAHGEAQMWGFVGLFILGIACRYLPGTTGRSRLSRFWHSTLLVVTLAGVIGGFVWALWPTIWPNLGPISGAAFLITAGIYSGFVWQQVRAKLAETWARFLVMSAGWLVVWAGWTFWLRWQYAQVGPNEYRLAERLTLISLSLAGFVLSSIYGFGLRLLSGLVATQPPNPHLIETTFWLHLLSVAATSVGWWREWPFCSAVGTLGWVGGAISYALAFGGFRRRRTFPHRPELGPRWADRYVQLAFFWLCGGSLLLAGGELHSWWTQQPTPHAWVGAARHALTVGFTATLIMGVAQRLVPVLEHTVLRWPWLCVPMWISVALGNLWRVSTELGTLVYPACFRWMPFSAVLELAALVMLSAVLLRTMWRPEDPLLRSGQATLLTPLALLLATHPWLENEMLQWGLRYVGRARAVPPELTLASFAESEGWSPQELLQRVNDALRNKNQGQAR